MLNPDNFVVIATSLANNSIAERRRNNIFTECSKYNIPVLFQPGIQSSDRTNTSFEYCRRQMNVFQNTKYEYALLCEDDFFPIENFLEELNTTVSLLPKTWRSLHLAPGYLWGRWFRDPTKIGKLNPEFDISWLKYDSSGRFFKDFDRTICFQKRFWLGGPTAVLVNSRTIESLQRNFEAAFALYKFPNDVLYTATLQENDFVCREPQLGYEKEEGGSCF